MSSPCENCGFEASPADPLAGFEALEDLRLTDHEIEAVMEAPAEDIGQFRGVLAQVLGYGRADAVPTRVGM